MFLPPTVTQDITWSWFAKMGFFSNCCKWLLFASNFLIFVLSCAGLGLGIWVLVDKSSFLDLLDQTDATVNIYESTAVLILIVAIGSIIITFFGCCGAHRESRCMLGTYFVLLLVLLILGLAGSITGMAQGVNRLSEPYLDTLSRYQRGRSGTIETTWDTIQRDMRCCGVNSPQDWTEYNSGFQINDDFELESSNLIQMSIKVPESCCSEAVDKRQYESSNWSPWCICGGLLHPDQGEDHHPHWDSWWSHHRCPGHHGPQPLPLPVPLHMWYWQCWWWQTQERRIF